MFHVRRGHPRRGDHLRSFLAQRSLPRLLGWFVVTLVVLGLALGFLFFVAEGGSAHSFWFWWRQATLLVAGLATTTTQGDFEGVQAVAQFLGALAGLIIPALFLGIVVFKAFVRREVYTKRKKLALLEPKDVDLPGENVDRWLAFRVYNSSRLQLVGVSFQAYARVKGASSRQVDIVTNVPMVLEKAEWPVSLTHVPYTVYSPLRAGDLEEHDGGVRLARIRDAYGDDRVVDSGCDILLVVAGKIPELGTDFVESHWYRADTDLSVGPFQEFKVAYPEDRRTWKGSGKWGDWGKFDGA